MTSSGGSVPLGSMPSTVPTRRRLPGHAAVEARLGWPILPLQTTGDDRLEPINQEPATGNFNGERGTPHVMELVLFLSFHQAVASHASNCPCFSFQVAGADIQKYST